MSGVYPDSGIFVLPDGSTVTYQRQAAVGVPVSGSRRRMGWIEEERILRCVTTKGRAPKRTHRRSEPLRHRRISVGEH